MNHPVHKGLGANGLASFYERLRGFAHKVLLLDYDGTLAPFRVRRDQALPYPGVREILARILAAGRTRLVIVSGRLASEVLQLLDLPAPPEIWGSHGWERYSTTGKREVFAQDIHILQGMIDLKEWLLSQGYADHFEMKPGSLAVHWRGLGAQDQQLMHAKISGAFKELSPILGLALREFDGGIELYLPARNKGLVVKTILDEMDGDVVAAYLGDDATDEDAFAALEGRGLSVLVRKEYRPTRAQAWLRPPDELLDFLNRWHRAHEGEAGSPTR